MQKGFTLIELLIVIAILAILATVIVLVLNPAQLLQETRDSQRFSDLATIRDAIGLYLAAGNTDMDAALTCGTNCWTNVDMTGTCNGRYSGETVETVVGRAVDNTGWVPINFGLVSGGSPFGALPVDPTNLAANNLVYSYACSGTTYELNANLESTRYLTTEDKDGTDGGNQTAAYEVGSSLTI